MSNLESRQCSWWPVHEYVEATIERLGVQGWPALGTPAWCALPDRDPRKWAAVLQGGEHWALRTEAAQVAMAEAADDIRRAPQNLDKPTTWPAIAKEAADLILIEDNFASVVAAVEVTVHKPQAPIPHDFADAAVTVHRTRGDLA